MNKFEKLKIIHDFIIALNNSSAYNNYSPDTMNLENIDITEYILTGEIIEE